MRKNNSVPVSMDFSYMRYEHMRAIARSNSHDLNARQTFSRASSLADLAYVAVPGLTSRVMRTNSTASLANLSDVFTDSGAPQGEAIVVEGGVSGPLVRLSSGRLFRRQEGAKTPLSA